MTPFPGSFIDELHSRASLASIASKYVRLTKKGNEYVGCCPFHKEKTPSFSINDSEGLYYCFGCGAKGNTLSFLMEIEKLSYPEAVHKLAEIVGLPVPILKPADEEKEKRLNSLYDVIELACCFFQQNLYGTNGRKALTYLKDRGITDDVIKQFRLGYSGGAGALRTFLNAKGVTSGQMVDSGLFTKPNTEGLSREYFHDRVMFPITDRKNRVIAFGGRVMDDGNPKYLNTPETELFHKGQTLFSLPRAIEAAKHSDTVILSEGYMDVIALNMHGYANSVAPLGTAFTEYQAEILWRMANEPVICFDGDTAGIHAAQRAAKLVLPLLKEGKSFNFLFLPDKMDPDELLKARGKEYFDNLLKNPLPLSSLLWNGLVEGKVLNTPERRSAVEKETKLILGQIKSESVRNFYNAFFNRKLWELKTGHTIKKANNLKNEPKTVIPKIKAGEKEDKTILAYMIYYPEIMSKWIEKISFGDSSDLLKKASTMITSSIFDNPNITKEELKQSLSPEVANYLACDFEILDRNLKMPQEIDEQMHEHFTMTEIKNLEKEIKETAAELAPYLNNPPQHLWEKYLALQEQKQKLEDELYN